MEGYCLTCKKKLNLKWFINSNKTLYFRKKMQFCSGQPLVQIKTYCFKSRKNAESKNPIKKIKGRKIVLPKFSVRVMIKNQHKDWTT